MIPAGALAISDPVNLRVPDRGDLAVSIYVPGNELAATEHSLGLQTTYISPEGDFTGADSLPTATTTQSFYFLTGVEVDAATKSQGHRHARRLDNRRVALDCGRQQALAESSGRAAALAEGR